MYKIRYYESNDFSSVDESLGPLSPVEIAKVLHELDLLAAFGLAVGTPLYKSRDKVYEVRELRVKEDSGRIRVLYVYSGQSVFTILYIYKEQEKGIAGMEQKILESAGKIALGQIEEEYLHDDLKKVLYAHGGEVAAEFKRLKPVYGIKNQVIQLRMDQGLSQADLARKIGTKQSAISRLESGEYNPSIDFLCKVADALGRELHIAIK